MSNVREGKNINNVFSKVIGLGKALLISQTTLTTIDGKPLVMRYNDEVEQFEKKEPFVPTPETPLVNERYATNAFVKGAEAVFNVPNSTGPLPQTMNTQSVEQIYNPVETPIMQNPTVIEQVTAPQALKNEIPEIKPVSISTPEIEVAPANTPAIHTPSIPDIEIPVLKGGDEVVDAINTQVLTPEVSKVETVSHLQTPQEAFKEVDIKDEKNAYIDVLDKIEKVRQMHLDALEGIRIETNRRFEELRKKYNEDFDNLSRSVEEARSNDMKAIKDTIVADYGTYNQNYDGITVNGR